MQGAWQNLGHRVARSTIAKVLRAHGISPVADRPLSWRTFLAAHPGAIAAADFFTTDVWTVGGLVTYYTVFVIAPCAPLCRQPLMFSRPWAALEQLRLIYGWSSPFVSGACPRRISSCFGV